MTQTSMKYLRKSKAGTSPKHSDGVHMEIKCTATEKFGLHCQLMKPAFCGIFFVCFYTMPMVSTPFLNQLFWTSLPVHEEILQAGYLECKIYI